MRPGPRSPESTHRRRRDFGGYVLIEALITIVVVSVGLLNVANLVVNSLKAGVSAASRTQAQMLAEDILDRMRANRTAALAVGNPYTLASGTATPTVTSSSTVATRDLSDWRTAVAENLPGPTSSISVNVATGMATVVITWADSRFNANVQNSGQLQVESRL